MSLSFTGSARRSWLFFLMLNLAACNALPAVDLAPSYEPDQFIVPASWRGASPFVLAKPADGEIRPDWWKLYKDRLLDKLEEEAVATNPDLQAAAERFLQARDIMMKTQSRLLPHIGVGFGASDNKQSENALFRGPTDPVYDTSVSTGGLASWEPDFWSAIRNATRAQIYRAEQRAAEYALARLSLQAEIAREYFLLRGYDAQNAIYKQSIAFYKQSLSIVEDRFKGKVASELDVARAKTLLFSTEAKQLEIDGLRQVTEHALAVLVNKSPSAFSIPPAGTLPHASFKIPAKMPSTLLERRPDVAGMEREMAQANRAIGIARAAFFPRVVFRADGGFEDHAFNLLKLANSFWAYGSEVSLPIFEGGMRRAQLQQSWSAYRETEDKYRSTVLNAFREVENGLSLTNRLSAQAKRQDLAVEAALKMQSLTMDLYQGGLNSSLDLIYAQVNTLEARIRSVEIKTRLLEASVGLIRSLGGGWDRRQLPSDDQIQPFGVLDYDGLEKPKPVGGIDVSTGDRARGNDLTNAVVTTSKSASAK